MSTLDPRLYTAIVNQQAEEVRTLLQDPDIDPSAEDHKALQAACVGNLQILRLLLADTRVNPAVENQYAIRAASSFGLTENVRLLLTDARVDPSVEFGQFPQYALCAACKEGATEIVRMLLADPRVTPYVESIQVPQLPIRVASGAGYTEIVRMLLADPRLDPSDPSIFTLASLEGKTEVVRLLLADKRVDPSCGGTQRAFREAVRLGRTDVVRLLLTDPRIDPSIANQFAFKEAVRLNFPEIVRLLLADPRVFPAITPEAAKMLQTFDLDPLVFKYSDDVPQFLRSVTHALDKASTLRTGLERVNLDQQTWGNSERGKTLMSANFGVGSPHPGRIHTLPQNALRVIQQHLGGPINRRTKTQTNANRASGKTNANVARSNLLTNYYGPQRAPGKSRKHRRD